MPLSPPSKSNPLESVGGIAAVVRVLRRRRGPRALVAAWLSLRYRCLVSPGATIDFPDAVRIRPGARIHACRIVAAGGGVDIGTGCEISDDAYIDTQGGVVRIGDGTAIGPQTIIYGLGGVSIGPGCSIAGQSMIVASKHDFEDPDVPIRGQGGSGAGIRIGGDVWIGAHCVVMDGAVIGDGCVVGAGSVVRGAFPDRCVIVGVPARVVRKRGDRKTA